MEFFKVMLIITGPSLMAMTNQQWKNLTGIMMDLAIVVSMGQFSASGGMSTYLRAY